MPSIQLSYDPGDHGPWGLPQQNKEDAMSSGDNGPKTQQTPAIRSYPGSGIGAGATKDYLGSGMGAGATKDYPGPKKPQ